jgi:hypothetical protein
MVAKVSEAKRCIENGYPPGVNHEEEDRKTETVYDGHLPFELSRLVDVCAIHLRKKVLRAKCLGRSDGPDHFFGDRTTQGNVAEGGELVFGHENVHESACNGNTGDDARDSEGEFP